MKLVNVSRVPVRLYDGGAAAEPAAVALHHLLRHSARLPRQLPEVSHAELRPLGDGPQRIRPPGGARQGSRGTNLR